MGDEKATYPSNPGGSENQDRVCEVVTGSQSRESCAGFTLTLQTSKLPIVSEDCYSTIINVRANHREGK